MFDREIEHGFEPAQISVHRALRDAIRQASSDKIFNLSLREGKMQVVTERALQFVKNITVAIDGYAAKTSEFPLIRFVWRRQ